MPSGEWERLRSLSTQSSRLHRRVHAAHVRFVDDGIVPGDARRTIIPPGEGRIDHAALRCAWRAVAPIEGQICLGLSGAIAEVCIAPHELTLQVPGIGLDQQLMRIESMAAFGLVRSVYAIAVQQSWPRLGKIGMAASQACRTWCPGPPMRLAQPVRRRGRRVARPHRAAAPPSMVAL